MPEIIKGRKGRKRKVTKDTLIGMKVLHVNGTRVIDIATAFDLSVATIRRAIKANFVYNDYLNTTRQAFTMYRPSGKVKNGFLLDKSLNGEHRVTHLEKNFLESKIPYLDFFGNMNTEDTNKVSQSIGKILHGLSIVRSAMTDLDTVTVKE